MTRLLKPLFDEIKSINGGAQPQHLEVRAIELFESPEIIFQRLLVHPPRPASSRHKDQRDGIEWVGHRIDIDLRVGGEAKPSRIGTRWTPNPWNRLFQLGADGTYLGHFFLLVRKNGEEDVLYKTADALRKVGDSSIPDAVRIALIKSDHNPDRRLGE